MQYLETITLKDGRQCCLRNGTAEDGAAALKTFNLTHEQTNWLLTYPDEGNLSVEGEAEYLQEKTDSANEIEIVAEVDGVIVGSAGIECVDTKEKVRHRAEFGISIEREFWGLGIGRALTQACIACAKQAGYAQLELDVVAQNERAIALYEHEGFVEYGRNPRGFCLRTGAWQEVVLMRLELDN